MCEKKDVIPDSAIKKMLENEVPSWQIRTFGVSPKRIARIAKGITSPPRGRPRKFSDSQCMFVIGLALADPEIKNKEIKRAFEEKYNTTMKNSH